MTNPFSIRDTCPADQRYIHPFAPPFNERWPDRLNWRRYLWPTCPDKGQMPNSIERTPIDVPVA